MVGGWRGSGRLQGLNRWADGPGDGSEAIARSRFQDTQTSKRRAASLGRRAARAWLIARLESAVWADGACSEIEAVARGSRRARGARSEPAASRGRGSDVSNRCRSRASESDGSRSSVEGVSHTRQPNAARQLRIQRIPVRSSSSSRRWVEATTHPNQISN